MERQRAYESQEDAALMRWREQQSRLAHAKAERFKREMMIKEEWERGQKKIEEAEEARKKSEDEKKRKQAELLAQIDAFIEGKAELPEEVNVSTQTNPGQPDCPFFAKTGACRFKDSCSRNHTRPGISRTLLVPNFYDHIGLQTLHQEEYDTDAGLEYEESETYQHFKEFYKDVLPEFEQCGKVIQFKVCNNEEPHLRGNVYVDFHSRRHALKAYRMFHGRFYAGRRLNVEFSNIPSWKNAICGLFHRQKCPKGKTCNFLHVFRNPNNAFRIHESSRRQLSRSRSRSPVRQRSRSKEWHWSDGSGSDSESKKRRSRSGSRGKVRSKRYDSGSERDRRSRSSSRSRSIRSKTRDSSRDRRKKRKERRRDERYRSRSRSPRDRKRYRDDSSKRTVKKDKTIDMSSEKERNGRGDKLDKKKSSKERTEKDDYFKKHRKEKNDDEKHDKKIKKRSSDESHSRYSSSDVTSTKNSLNGNL